MNRKIYLRRMTFSRYNENECLAYLNEEVIDGFVPDDAPEDFQPVTGYAYTGTEDDGGTLIKAADDSRDALINGVIRNFYSQSEEDAVKTHQLICLTNPACEKAEEYASEWTAFNVQREMAIMLVDSWLE